MLLHIACGLGCLVAGPWAMLARPKGGALHRLAGRLWIVLMSALAGTAAFLLCFRWSAFFFALSVLSFYLAFSGWRVLKRKRPHLNPAERAKPVDYLAALAAIATGIASVLFWQRGIFGNGAAIVLGTLGFAVVTACYDLWRFRFPSQIQLPGTYLIEHLAKQGGAYIAVASAFSGTVLTVLPIAVAQTWPAFVGVPLILVVSNRYWRRLRKSTPQSAP